MADYFNLDQATIAEEIKSYMKNNSTTFKDYNFEGSALSGVVNMLAFVTQYNMFYLNMVSSEIFMSTAKMEENVLRLSNMLNYLPQRNAAASVTLDIKASSAVTLAPYTQFTHNDIHLTYIGETLNLGVNGTATITCMQGTWTTLDLLYAGSDFEKMDLGATKKVDNYYLNITSPDTDTVGNPVTRTWNLVNNKPSTISDYFVYTEYTDSFYIIFDKSQNGLFAIPPKNTTVTISYLLTDGVSMNGAIPTNTVIGTCPSYITAITTSVMSGGIDAESLDSIKRKAVLFYNTQQRAVTQNDYNTIIQNYEDYLSYKGISIWGGEKETVLDTATYTISTLSESATTIDKGFVYYSGLKNTSNPRMFGYMETADTTAITEYLDQYKVISLKYRYLDPNIIYIEQNYRVKPVTNHSIDITAFEADLNNYFYDTYTGFNNTWSKSGAVGYVVKKEVVEYADLNYDTYMKCRIKNQKYKPFRTNAGVNSMLGYIMTLQAVSPTISVGDVLYSSEGNYGRIIDAGNHISGVSATVSIALTGTISGQVDLVTNSATVTATISFSDKIYNSGTLATDLGILSTISIQRMSGGTQVIGTLNLTTGYGVLNTLSTCSLLSAETISFYLDLTDDISLSSTRETLLCPTTISAVYI